MNRDTRTPTVVGLSLRTASRAVADALRDEINRGTLAPGTRLRQNDLAARFGVSSTPVREALAYLEAEGLLQGDPRRGAVVFQPSLKDFEEAFMIRAELEPMALIDAMPRMTEHDLTAGQELVDLMRTIEDNVRWVELNDAFHLGLYQRSDNQRLLDIIENLRKASRYYIHAYVVGNRKVQGSDDEHQAILDALRRQDGAAAGEVLRLHLRHTVEGVLRWLNDEATISSH